MKTKLTKSKSLLVAFLMLGSVAASAQDTGTETHQVTIQIPEVALLDLETAESSKEVIGKFVQPTPAEAGQALTVPSANSTLWLNYSSVQKLEHTKRVDVTASALVAGVKIHLSAGAPVGGGGTVGQATAGFDLTTGPQTLVNSIGSAYTGTGVGAGHPLTYQFVTDANNYADLRSGNKSINVTYTLAEN